MISAYNREVETEKEYNGRQLLELLQNADDEKSDEVLIELDTKKNILTVSNRGVGCKPFSYEGIRSLMISNLSSKATKKFIGNKGLGFRSIINWSEEITINSNGLDVLFARKVVNNIYDELFNSDEQKRIRKERNLPENLKPIPFLSIPKITDNKKDDWTTTVSITYKSEFLKDIQKQINELKNEILLFLNSIQKLTVIIDNDIKLDIKKETLSQKWKIFQKREKLPNHLWDKENEEEYYDLKIALQDNLENDIKELFSYFPTKIDINFPFIVHGTFELNSSRNELNNSPKNIYILEQLVELIISTAKDITIEEVSYKALEMLSHPTQNNILKELGFYEAIDTAIKELEIFPCLDGHYRAQSNVVYIDVLSRFSKQTNNEHLFENLLIPTTENISLNVYCLSNSIETEKLNELSKNIENIDERVDLIYMFYNTFKHEEKLLFLIDNNNELISLDDDVYTPARASLSIPDYVKVKFINQELFQKLILKFGITSSEHKSRDLQGKLKEITNIQEYAFLPILRKISITTNIELQKEGANQIDIVKKMVQALYQNYIQLDKVNISNEIKIQLLNINHLITDSKNLYLSKSYPSGKLTEFLFNDIFTSDDFLADVSKFGFNQEDSIEEIEEFFLWLGVNKYTKFVKITSDNAYSSFVFKYIQKPINYRSYSISVTAISDFKKIIEKLSYEKIILWFSLDKEINIQLDNNNNTDSFRYDKTGENYNYFSHKISPKPSYIVYQIHSSNIFQDYLIGNEKLSPLINTIEFDFDFDAFKEYKVDKLDVERVLLKIGATDKFEQLSINSINRIVKELPIKAEEGKQTQSIYKLCIKHFETNNKSLNDKDIMLFATKEDVKGYFPLKEIFYNGNIKLPKKITNSRAILNYPRRQSTTNVINFFGVNNLSSLIINVLTQDVQEKITNDFNYIFEQIKPYILVYRIQDREGDKNAREELVKLKNINIQLCTNVKYQIDNKPFELEVNDYIKGENSYLIKINNNISINQLRSEFDFQESFADIIGLVFDIQDTKIFRDMIKEEPAYIEKTVRNDIGSDELVRARELLGISDEYFSFWKTIYTIKNKDYTFADNPNMLGLIKNDLNLTTEIEDIDFNRLDTSENGIYIKQLFNELDVDVQEFNNSETAYYKINLEAFHSKNMKLSFDKNLIIFKKRLYTWCIENNSERLFTELISKYNDNVEFIKEQAFSFKNNININYDEIVQSFIDENFEITKSDVTLIDFTSVYRTNSSLIDLDELNGNTEFISLLFFENKIDEIKAYIKKNHVEPKDKEDNDTKGEQVRQSKPIDIPIFNAPTLPKANGNKNTKPYKHKSKSDNRKKEIGDNSEQVAYNSLVDIYGKDNVHWASLEDDSCGYDFMYINDDGISKYVEVKTYSGTQFYISRNEKEFAEKHFGSYEIFLVGDTIHKIIDVDFYDSSKFILVENEFIVRYDIS